MLKLCILFSLCVYSMCEVSLQDDPSLFPGHMEPFGAKQPRTEIERLTEYPSAEDFFENYIKPGRPFLLKKGAMEQPAYKLWTNEYMKNFPEASEELVQVEPNKKEIREAAGFEVPLKTFIERYQNEAIYMVNKVPTFLQKDVLMPSPLRCNSTRELMLDHVTWISSGGTKSVVHNDDLDNINCLFRGTKELMLIDPKYRSKVPLDKPQGGYSTIDVDKVNFTKYPSLREVEYVHCKMEQGDCLFIPYRWIHQVNSVANDDRQNIAVNIWFRHDPMHKPENCDVLEENSTINNWFFPGMDGGEEQGEENPLLGLFEYILSKTKYKRANSNTFVALLIKVPGIFVEESISHLKPSNEFITPALEMYEILNVNGDKYFDEEDIKQINSNPEGAAKLEVWLNDKFDEIQLIVTSELVESAATKNDGDEEFEKDSDDDDQNENQIDDQNDDNYKKIEL